MVTKNLSSQADKNRLQSMFDALKQECAYVDKLTSSARQVAYENYAKIYFWWSEARLVEGFVEGMTSHITSYKHRAVNHGINFSPLLVVLFNNTLSDVERNRASRMLNVLHKQVQANPEMYVHDKVTKLAGFIKKAGGVVALANTTYKNGELAKGEGSQEERAEKYEQDQAKELADITAELAGYGIKYVVKPRPSAVKAKPISDADKVKVLTKAAETYFAKASVDNFVTFSNAVSLSPDGYSSVLIKRQGNGFVVVDMNDDPKQVLYGRVAAFRKQYQALPNSLRVICETLRTQIEPWNMATPSEIVEANPDPTLEGEEKIARNHLLYLSKTKQFVLSQARMPVGVVTMVTPTNEVMEPVPYDVVMAPYSTALAELRLIGTCDFNLYETASTDMIPTANDKNQIFSHCLQVKGKVKGLEPFTLLFKSFSKELVHKSCQPVYSTKYDATLATQIELPMSTIYGVSRNFATPWAHDLGQKIARSQYNQIGIKFTGSHIVISDTYEDGKFSKHESLKYSDDLSSEQLYSGIFLTKDILPVLVALGNLPIEGNVKVAADANVLTFKFKTNAASYVVAIPAFDMEKKQRRTAAFKSYQPSVRKLTAAEEEEEFINQLVSQEICDDYSEDGCVVLPEDTNTWEIYSHV